MKCSLTDLSGITEASLFIYQLHLPSGNKKRVDKIEALHHYMLWIIVKEIKRSFWICLFIVSSWIWCNCIATTLLFSPPHALHLLPSTSHTFINELSLQPYLISQNHHHLTSFTHKHRAERIKKSTYIHIQFFGQLEIYFWIYIGEKTDFSHYLILWFFWGRGMDVKVLSHPSRGLESSPPTDPQ